MVLKNRSNEIRSNDIRIRRELPVCGASQIYSGDFAKSFDLLKICELYNTFIF